MKKLFSVLAVLFVLGTANTFATGIGLQAGPVIGSGVGFGGAVTFKLDKVPCVFAVSVPSFNPLAIGATADWWISNPKIEGTWGWFYGIGLAGAVYLANDAASLRVGGRAFIGTNVFLVDNFLELYLEGAWQPMIHLDNGVHTALVNFPVDFGFRFWF